MGANTNPVAAPGHVDSPIMDAALAQFADQSFIHRQTTPTVGRTVWQADLEAQVRSIEEELLQN